MRQTNIDRSIVQTKPVPFLERKQAQNNDDNDNDDDIPILSSNNLNAGINGVMGGGVMNRVSEHPHVSPIKEVDESALLLAPQTPYSKHNSKSLKMCTIFVSSSLVVLQQ